MEAVYEQHIILGDVTLAGLFELMQQSASMHQSTLGVGREEMYRRGLLWMITQQKLTAARLPVRGETAVLRTWLSEARHGMYLRQYELTDADGGILCRAAAVWALVDAEKHSMVRLPLGVPLVNREGELPRLSLLRPVETLREYRFTVPREFIDENGHMNNARYFNAVEPALPHAGVLRAVQVDYHAEAREGDSLAIGYAAGEKEVRIQAQGDRGLCFRMKVEYE